MIPVDECKDRQVYAIDSRNLTMGVYDSSTKSFWGIRNKFGREFPDKEYHWDNGPPYGTARPTKCLDMRFPDDILLQDDMGTECATCNKTCEYSSWPDGAENLDSLPGVWVHTEKSECKKVEPVMIHNEALGAWLKNMVSILSAKNFTSDNPPTNVPT